jgi:hypothetical protein
MSKPTRRRETSRARTTPRGNSRSPSPRRTSDRVPEPPPTVEALPDYEIETPRQRRREFLKESLGDLRVKLVLALVVLIVCLAIFAPSAYRKVKVWRSTRLMEQCQAVAESGNITEAISLMRQAVLLSPNDEGVFKKVRLFNAGLGDPSALAALQAIMLEQKATEEELLVLAEQSLRSDKTVITSAALDKLKDSPSARRTIVEMRLLTKQGNPQAAIDLAQASLDKVPTADAEKILLATAEMVLKSDLKASQEILLPLAKKRTVSGLLALRLLASQQVTCSGQGSVTPTQVAQALTAHPLHSADDTLLAADLQILENPASKPALIASLRKARSKASDEDNLALARWLNRRLAYQETIDFIGRDRALSDAKWLLIYLDAHAGLERWNDVFTMLDAETVGGLSDSIRLLFLARAADKSGERQRAEDTWREMQRGLVFEKPEVVAFIAAYAMRIGERDQALKAYSTLAHRKETALEGFLGLIRCWPSTSPAAELLPIYTEFLEVYPNLAEARCDFTYIQLLTNQNLSEAATEARTLHQKDPSSLATLSVAALGFLKKGDAANADALYNGKMIAWSSAPAPWKTIRAAVLYAVGKTAEADSLSATIKKSQLRPEERALLPAE